jgi:hypothetical protein
MVSANFYFSSFAFSLFSFYSGVSSAAASALSEAVEEPPE